MQLEDASGKASVDIFTRSLDFDFRGNLVFGLPGDVLGIEAPTSRESLPILLHELEHVRTLMYPLDALFTAIGLRIADLRREAAEQFNQWADHLSPSTIEDLREEAHRALQETERAARFSRSVIYTAELMLPLLEGLALLAELEIGLEDASRSWDIVVAMQYEHSRRITLIKSPSNQHTFDAATQESKSRYREILGHLLERQLEVSREDRRLTFRRRLFFRERFDSDPRSSNPYFFGYLFIRRLYECWAGRVSDLAFGRFYHVATRAFCEVVPLSILRLYTLSPERFVTDDFTKVFSWTLDMLLSLPVKDLELIEKSGELLAMRPNASGRGEVYQLSPAGVHFDDTAVMKFVQYSVFDSPDLESPDQVATTDDLVRLERSKFLSPLATLSVRIAAIDEELRALLMVHPVTVGQHYEGPVDSSAVTFFVFSSQSDFSHFVDAYDNPEHKLPRIIRRGDQIVISGQSSLVGVLQTYLFFYPSGLPSVRDHTFHSPVTGVQTLLISDAKSQNLFISSGSSGNHDEVLGRLADRNVAGKLREHIRRALEPTFEEFRYALEQIDVFYVDYRPEVRSALRAIRQGWFDRTQAECAAVYASLLFPGCKDLDAIRTEKLSILQKYLSRPDFMLLQTCLLDGAVLHPRRHHEFVARSDSSLSDAVNRIRQACMDKLGVPLVKLQPDPLALVLELCPTEAPY